MWRKRLDSGTPRVMMVAIKAALVLCSLVLWPPGSSAGDSGQGHHTPSNKGNDTWGGTGSDSIYAYAVGITTVDCGSHSMMVTASRLLPGFSSVGLLLAKEPMSWYLDIDNGTAQWSIPVADGLESGYKFKSHRLTLAVTAEYTARGIFHSQLGNTSLYFLDLRMHFGPTTAIYLFTPMLCLVPSYLQCDDTNLVVTVPPLPGPLGTVALDSTLVYPGLPPMPGVDIQLQSLGGFVLTLSRASPLATIATCPMGLSSGVRHSANMSVTFRASSRPLTFPLQLNCPCIAVQDDVSATCNGSMLLAVFGPLYGPPPAILQLSVGNVMLLTPDLDPSIYTYSVEQVSTGSYYLTVSADRTAPGVDVQAQGPGLRLYSALFTAVVRDGLGLSHNYSVQAACDMAYSPSGVVSCGPAWLAVTLQSAAVRGFSLLVAGVPVSQLLGYNLTSSASELRLQVAFTALNLLVKTLPDGSTERSFQLTLVNAFAATEQYTVVCTSNTAVCSADGFMTFEVYVNSTRPPLDLATVHVRDRSCLPVAVTAEKAVFVVPLDSCGTTRQEVDDTLVYENEAVSLMRDSIFHIISRSSEYRMSISCSFAGSDWLPLGITVPTLSPPGPATAMGPLRIELTMFPDADYITPYGATDYPLIRFLRDPLFVQVQLLEHLDPTLELRVSDCWATSQPDPDSLPQWDLIVSGCPFSGDNYLTTVLPVTPGSVPLYLRFKRFEVKTFVFADPAPLGALRDTLYFHCSATVCDSTRADLPQCGVRSCSPRSVRDAGQQAIADEMTRVASLAGPVVLTNEVSSRSRLPVPADFIGAWPWGVLAIGCAIAAGSVSVALVATLLYRVGSRGRQATWRREEPVSG